MKWSAVARSLGLGVSMQTREMVVVEENKKRGGIKMKNRKRQKRLFEFGLV